MTAGARSIGRIRSPATFSVVSGLVLFADLGLHLLDGLGRGYFALAMITAAGLLGAPAALWRTGVFTSAWRRAAGRAGTGLVALGALLWIAAFTLLLTDPAAAFTQRLTPAGSAVMALGMIVCGAGALASPGLPLWRTAMPLLVGIYFPTQLVIQLSFFLGGKDSTPGPNGILLGVWGLLWALCGYAIASARRQPDARDAAPAQRQPDARDARSAQQQPSAEDAAPAQQQPDAGDARSAGRGRRGFGPATTRRG